MCLFEKIVIKILLAIYWEIAVKNGHQVNAQNFDLKISKMMDNEEKG